MGIVRHLFEKAPSIIRAPISRKRLNISSAIDGGRVRSNNQEATSSFIIKVAQTQDELAQAFRILHDSYVAKKYMSPTASQMRVTPYHVLPTTTTLVAILNNKVVGTMSVIKDGVFGIPTDNLFDLSFIRKQGYSLAEISSLAIDPLYRSRGGACLFLLIKFMFEYVQKMMGVEVMAISVNPSQEIFYDDILLFNKIPQKEVKAYNFVEGAPAIGRYAIITDLKVRMQQVYGTLSEEKNLHQYLFNSRNKQVILPKRNFYKLLDPVMNTSLLNHFINQEPNIFESISTEKRLQLLRHYQGSVFADYLKNHLFSEAVPLLPINRQELRFETANSGFYKNNSGEGLAYAKVNSVALHGLRLHIPKKITKKQRNLSKLILDVAVAPDITSQLKLEVVANPQTDSGETYCCRILDADNNWENYISFLKADFDGLTQSSKEPSLTSLKSAA